MSASLLDLAGLKEPPATDVEDGAIVLDARAWEALVSAASLFRRAGGLVLPEWWASLSPVEQLALVEAGDRLSASVAAAMGVAGQGPRGAAAALSRVDGGRALLRLELEEAAGRVASSAAGEGA